MGIATTTPPVVSTPLLRNRQHLAWGTMLVAFSVFCAFAALAVIGIHYFIFQSSIPIQGQLQVSRGTATLIGADLIEQAVRNERNLGSSGIIITDPQSQAIIIFQDQYADNAPIAIVTLKKGASVNARQFVRPRFDLSSEPYRIQLDEIIGEFDIDVPIVNGRDVVLTAQSRSGTRTALHGAGRYTVSATDTQMQVVNYAGDALLIMADGREFPIPSAQRGVAQLQESPQFNYAPALVSLLGAPGFSSENVLEFNAAAEQVRPYVWRCSNSQDTLPSGQFGLVTENGFPALRLFRGDGAESHGETRCVQGFNGTQGLDVSLFRHLSVRVTFKIRSHSLSLCGIDGSECPLMVKMEFYTDDSSEVQHWIHGFYASFNPLLADFPPTCDTCAEYHEIVNLDRWYTYESDNLLPTLELLGTRPASILNVRFYASGHQYEVYVSEVELLVDQAVIPLPVIEGQG